MDRATVGRRLVTLAEAIVADHGGDAQSIVAEDAVAAFDLRRSMGRQGPPPPHGRLVAPVRQRQRSEEHTSELQSLMRISYAVFCLKKKKENTRMMISITRSYIR